MSVQPIAYDPNGTESVLKDDFPCLKMELKKIEGVVVKEVFGRPTRQFASSNGKTFLSNPDLTNQYTYSIEAINQNGLSVFCIVYPLEDSSCIAEVQTPIHYTTPKFIGKTHEVAFQRCRKSVEQKIIDTFYNPCSVLPSNFSNHYT